MTDRTGLILAIDGGSQSTKVTIFDAHGMVLGQGRAPLRPYVLGPQDQAVHPDDDLWDSLCTASRLAMADLADAPVQPGAPAAMATPQDIVAIGL
ncbi:MAG: hypothetical protein WA962_13985, partial [Ornithinimicrobium sp.]